MKSLCIVWIEGLGARLMEKIMHDLDEVQRTSSKIARIMTIVVVSGLVLYFVGSAVAKLIANGTI